MKWCVDMKLSRVDISLERVILWGLSCSKLGYPGYSITHCFSLYITISLIRLKLAAPIDINPGLN